jgi:UDP-glucuronate decarboxylase
VGTPFRATVDCIFHLAVPSTRMACEPDPVKAAMTCVCGTMNVLEVAAAHGARLVLATATERWGEGVRCAEALAADFARARDADVRLVRMPSAYGPRMTPDGDHLVTSLVMQAFRGQALAPRMRLDRRVRLAYVDDAVETLIRTMKSKERTPPLVAPSCEASVLELAQLVAQAAGLVDASVTDGSVDGPPSMPLSSRLVVADAVPAGTALGVVPCVELAEGLERTVRWFAVRTGRTPEACGSGVFRRDSLPPAVPVPVKHRAG